MAKGIVYVTTSEIDGLVKIGKTTNLENRKKELSTAGYMRQKCDMVYAIEVDDYDKKEKLLHTIFGKVRAAKTEFFAENIEVVIQTLSAFEGKQVFPAESETSKKESFQQATDAVESSSLPDGDYTLEVKSQGSKQKCKGLLNVKEGKLTLKKDSVLSVDYTTKNITKGWIRLRQAADVDENHVLQEDIECKSVSQAAYVVIGTSKNGWEAWLDKDGESIQKYKPVENEDED